MCGTGGRRRGEGLPCRLAPTEVLAKEGYLQPEQEREEKAALKDACRLVVELRGEIRGPHRMPDWRHYLGQSRIQLQLPQTWEPKLGLEPISPVNQDLKF